MKYFVTTVKHNGDTRCIGYYDTLKQAQKVVTKQADTICEAGWYTWAVIEGFGPGWHPTAKAEEWYQLTLSHNIVYAIPCIHKPKQFKNTCNFGIG